MDSSSSAIELRITTMMPHLNEKQRRLFLATEAKAIGHGGNNTNQHPIRRI